MRAMTGELEDELQPWNCLQGTNCAHLDTSLDSHKIIALYMHVYLTTTSLQVASCVHTQLAYLSTYLSIYLVFLRPLVQQNAIVHRYVRHANSPGFSGSLTDLLHFSWASYINSWIIDECNKNLCEPF